LGANNCYKDRCQTAIGKPERLNEAERASYPAITEKPTDGTSRAKVF
jgi:hypothetical protein